MSQRKLQYWVIPPEANSEFVANMEEVLETYAQPYDQRFPVMCMDEQPVQLLKETRVPVAATTRHPRRVDYEYERAGTASIFMFCEPLSGWREVHVRPQRTKIDWLEVKWPQPSGSSERLKNLPIDRYIKIVEGEGQWK